MPRKKKDVVESDVKNTVIESAPQETAPRSRKPYPTHDERILMADAKIAQLEKLVAERKALLEKCEDLAAQRRDSLAKTEETLKAAAEKRVRIVALRDRPAKQVGVRAKKAADKAALAELQEKLEASGKTVDELLALLNH